MIRSITLTLAIAGLLLATSSAAISATIYKAKHGGTISRIGSYNVELVTTRKGDDVDMMVYVIDEKDAPVISGDMVLSIVGADGKAQEVVLKPETEFFRGTTRIVERGPIEIHETFTTVGGTPSVAVIKVPAIR